MYGDVFIKVPESQWDEFFSELEQSLKNGWTRNHEAESGPSMEKVRRYFDCAATNQRKGAMLALVPSSEKPGTLYVSNVVPDETGRLTHEEYNAILKEFFDCFVVPVAKKLQVQATITPENRNIEEWLSPDSFRKLQIFSQMANKSTGSAHPLDQKRWFDFVIASVNNSDKLDSTLLGRWLVEEAGWSDKVAESLCIEFEQQTGLLKQYREK